jgi:SAM-dependent methyltransferase
VSAASHSVASHLALSPAKYDARIRTLIPLYDELIAEAARALGHAARPVRTIVDLGIGTGALARACLESAPGTRIWGIDADADMMAVARARLGRLSRRATMTTGSFLDTALPQCDAMVASYSLHHIRSSRETWADEDVYVPLADEIDLLERAGFGVDVPWRSPFAVIVASRQA